MGLFKKKEVKKDQLGLDDKVPELPKLPELPRLDAPPKERPPQLPSFPKNIVGQKFSQDAIKDAVSGEKEVDMGEADLDSEPRTMSMPPTHDETYSKDIDEAAEAKDIPKEWKAAATKVRNAEPVFVRIDKFEQTLKTFEKAKDKIMEIEKMLKDIRKLKDKEEEELNNWEKEIQTTKNQIERVDQELFSKIE